MAAILLLEEGMKKSLFSVLILGLVLTACGGTVSTTAPAATEPVMQDTMTSAPPPAATATEAATQPAPVAGDKVQVEVTEGDNWIKSSLTTFKVGVPYVFTVTNTGRRAHIFSISHPVTDRSLNGMDAAQASALVLVPREQLLPGAVATVEHTFTEPAPAGTLEFACLILMHYNMGQYLSIVVE